jgi:outer membrane receptor for ferrienterochelin and colicin
LKVRIAHFLLIGACLAPFPVLGQEDEDIEDEFAFLEEELSADEVKSASKRRQSIFWSPSTITVFTREDIRASGATVLSDLLRRVPGFDVIELKPSLPLVGARALTESSNNLVLVLVDGREALIEMAGFPIWSAMTIDMEEIERIEIIRGPGSSLYGANAFAAVVNITTMTDRPPASGEVLVSGGEIGFRNLVGRVQNNLTLGDGNLSFRAAVGNGQRHSPSDRDNDEMLHQWIRSHGYIRYQHGKDLDLSLHYGAMYGVGFMYVFFGDFIDRNVLNHYVTAKADIGLTEGLRLQAQVYHIRFDGDFHFRSTIKAFDQWLANIPDLFIDTNTVDVQVQLDWKAADWLHLIGGANLRYTTLVSDKVVAQELSELRGAGFLQAQLELWDLLQVTGGIRLEGNSKTDAAISPRVALVLRTSQDQAFRLSYGLAFRKPSFLESQLHIDADEFAFDEVQEKLRTCLGNEDTNNEKVHSIEAGWRAWFLEDQLRVTLDTFFNIYQHMIYLERYMDRDSFGAPYIPGSIFQYQNMDEDTYAFGGELELAWKLSEEWNLWGNVGFRWVTDSDFERVKTEPVLRSNLGGRWTSTWGIFVDLALHYVSDYDVPLILPEKPFEDALVETMGNRWMLIGRLGYQIPFSAPGRIELGLTARAPLGEPFREYPGVPMESNARSGNHSDWGGEVLMRWVSVYLRGSF